MKKLLSLLLIVVGQVSIAQVHVDSVFSAEGVLISVMDRNGKYTLFDEQGEVAEKGQFKNGKKEGKWEKFQDGLLIARGQYVLDLPEGEWEFFDYDHDASNKEFAFVRSIGRYKKGQREGYWEYYIGNGGYSTDAGWVNKKEFYYGYLVLAGTYTSGLRQGQWDMKDISTGKTIGAAHFEKGKKTGTWEIEKGLSRGRLLTISPSFLDSVEIKEKFDNGTYAIGIYSAGKKTGAWKLYDANRQLIRTTNEGGTVVSSDKNFSQVNIVLPNLYLESINRIVFSENKKYVMLCQDKNNGEFQYWLWDMDQKKMLSSNFFQTRKNTRYGIGLGASGKLFYVYDYTDSPPYTYLYTYDIATGKEQENHSVDGHIGELCFFYHNKFYQVQRDQQKGLVVSSGKEELLRLGEVKDQGRYIRQIICLEERNEVLVMYSEEVVAYDLRTKRTVRTIAHDRAQQVWVDRNYLVLGAEKFSLYDLTTFKKLSDIEIPGYDHGKMDADMLQRSMRFTVSPSGKTLAVGYEKNSGFGSPLFVIDLEKKSVAWESPMNLGDCDDGFLLVNDSCLVLPRFGKKNDGHCSSQLHWYNFRKDKVIFSTRTHRWFEVSSVIQFDRLVNCTYQDPGKIFSEKMNSIDLSTGHFAPLQKFNNGKHFQVWSDSLKKTVVTKITHAADIEQKALCIYPLDKILQKNKENAQLQPTFFEEVKTGGFDESKLVYYAYGNKASYENKTRQGKELVFWNGNKPTESERKVTLQVLDNGDHIFYSPDRYYMGSKNIRSHIYFEKDLKLYPFEQFDLKYNRPDLVLARLGYADTALVQAYRNAYLKRLKKMNFTEEMLKDDFHLPEIIIENAGKIPPVLSTDSLELNLRLKDEHHLLDRVQIWINDVPVYGVNGMSVREKSVQQYEARMYLKLAKGKNKIQVSVLNQAGIESLKETIYTDVQEGKNTLPDLYLVSIGAGKFADARYNLAYAVKDAQDIAKTFGQNTSRLYNKVHTYVLPDAELNTARLAELKKALRKASRNDVVVVTISDHGVLDKDFNYYLATYEMDFADPSKKGLAYEQVENLIDGIAPLKKVVLLDACHSGEIDKEEVVAMTTENTSNQNGITFRNAGAGIQKKNLGLKTSTELMTELFTDLRRGTGATVISSAGGMELAVESDQWKNGLFTYCLLNGLSTKAADLDRNGAIMVSELQEYLQTEVMRLSKGQQQPTSRQENAETDFRIW